MMMERLSDENKKVTHLNEERDANARREKERKVVIDGKGWK